MSYSDLTSTLIIVNILRYHQAIRRQRIYCLYIIYSGKRFGDMLLQGNFDTGIPYFVRGICCYWSWLWQLLYMLFYSCCRDKLLPWYGVTRIYCYRDIVSMDENVSVTRKGSAPNITPNSGLVFTAKISVFSQAPENRTQYPTVYRQ